MHQNIQGAVDPEALEAKNTFSPKSKAQKALKTQGATTPEDRLKNNLVQKHLKHILRAVRAREGGDIS